MLDELDQMLADEVAAEFEADLNAPASTYIAPVASDPISQPAAAQP